MGARIVAADRSYDAVGPVPVTMPPGKFDLAYLEQLQSLCERLRADPRATVEGTVAVGRHAHGG